MKQSDGPAADKQALRRQALQSRKAQENKDEISRKILTTLRQSNVYQRARTVLFYVSAGSEVRTTDCLRAELHTANKTIVVPYCVQDHLELFRLESFDELAWGSFGILEPQTTLRSLTDRQVDVGVLDLVVIPAVAFDPRCRRLGNGWGYYDRLLAQLPPHTSKVGIAFQCQILPSLPLDHHDVNVDTVLTEQNTYPTPAN